MSRQTDRFAAQVAVQLASTEPAPAQVAAIDWTRIGKAGPQALPNQARSATDPLPKADVVIITWTNAEWSALDHIFLNSGSARGAEKQPGTWSLDWQPYARNVGAFTSDERGYPLWGTFRLADVPASSGTKRVLLFHSNAHLQYEPYIDGLRAMVTNVLADGAEGPCA